MPTDDEIIEAMARALLDTDPETVGWENSTRQWQNHFVNLAEVALAAYRKITGQ